MHGEARIQMIPLIRSVYCLLISVLLSTGEARGTAPHAGYDQVPLQLFGIVDQYTVALGEPFQFKVELYSSPPSKSAYKLLEHEFEAGTLLFNEEDIEFVRSEGIEVHSVFVDGLSVTKFSENYVLRARRTGSITLLGYEMEYEGQKYSVSMQQLEVFHVEPAFFRGSRSILPIWAEARNGSRIPDRTGTAFLIGPDAVMTSFHVVMDAHRVRLQFPNDEIITTKKAWVLDPVRDIAILYVEPKKVESFRLPYLELAPFDNAVRLESEFDDRNMVVFTNGWSSGRQRSTAGLYFRSVSLQQHEPVWISRNPLRPGDSGGPLLDEKGRVLGVVASGTLYRSKDQLREDVCIATDPRPALGMKMLASRPRSLKSLLKDPDVVSEPRFDVLRVSAALSIGHMGKSFLEESLARLDEGIMRTPNDARLYYLRGTILEMRGTVNEAIASYKAALEAYEGYFPATYMLALNQMNRRNYEEAGRLFARTRLYPPYTHLAYYGEALSLIGRYKYEEAIPNLLLVVSYDPTFAPAFFDLARCYFALGEEDRARQLVVKLDEISPVWAEGLRKMLRYPVFQPFVPVSLPLAPIPLITVL